MFSRGRSGREGLRSEILMTNDRAQRMYCSPDTHTVTLADLHKVQRQAETLFPPHVSIFKTGKTKAREGKARLHFVVDTT